MKLTMAFVGCAVAAGPVAAQDQDPDLFGRLSPYGRFLAHVAVFEDQAELQDNGSWLGADFEVGDDVQFFAGIELGVALIQGTSFNAGATTGSSTLTLEEETAPVFGARLGYVGVDLGTAGRVAIGKQSSVFYDIASYTTDQFNVFGGQASQAYTAGSDGGRFGTGRVDQALTYRISVGDLLELGGQTQFSAGQTNAFIDGFGLSAQVRPLSGLVIGAAYNRSILADDLEQMAIGLDGNDSEFGILGARYTSDFFDLAAVVSTQKNGDAIRLSGPPLDEGDFVPVFFDATGVEIFAKIRPGDFSVLGGFIYNEPDPTAPELSEDFVTRYAILGAEYRFRTNTYLYTEWRLDDSTNFDGSPSFSVFTVGMRYGFRLHFQHGTY